MLPLSHSDNISHISYGPHGTIGSLHIMFHSSVALPLAPEIEKNPQNPTTYLNSPKTSPTTEIPVVYDTEPAHRLNLPKMCL